MFHMHTYCWQVSSYGKKIWIEVTSLSEKGIYLTYDIKYQINRIEGGGLICDLVFVIRCVSIFLCFSISFSLIFKELSHFLQPPPPTHTPQSNPFFIPQEKTLTIWTQEKPKTSKKRLYKELVSFSPQFN